MQAPGNNQRFDGIQIARGLAALSVCYFHSWTALDRFPHGTAHPLPFFVDKGWVGVDLFFAISGFVICLVATRKDFAALPFLVHRSFRLYPLWLATLTLFAILAMAWRGPTESETLGYFLYSATLLPTHEYPFYDIGWSLQHEMAFYLLVALIAPSLGIAGVIAALGVAILASHFLAPPWPIASFASYYGEFLAGILAYLALPLTRRAGSVVPLAIGGVLLYLFFDHGGRDYFPIALFVLMTGFANLRAPRSFSFAQSLGDASYSIYLLHPLIYVIAKAATKAIADRGMLWIEEPIRFACIALTISLAMLSWRLFERPIISWSKLQRQDDRVRQLL